MTVAANHVIGFSRRSHKNLIAPHSENQRSQSWALGANVEDAREEAMTSASGGGRHPSSRDQAVSSPRAVSAPNAAECGLTRAAVTPHGPCCQRPKVGWA